MFARTVSFHLKPGRAGEFTRLLDQDIIPVLRKQKGFQDEISLVAAGGAEAVGISVWDLKEDAETYARSAYAGVLKALEPVVEGTPQVQTYEVSNSTFHKIAVLARLPEADTSVRPMGRPRPPRWSSAGKSRRTVLRKTRRIIMTIVRWDAFRDMAAREEQLSRMLAGFYARPQEDLTRGAWVPAVDIYSNGQHELVLKAELPDMKEEEIELTVEDNTLTLRGEKKLDTEVSEEQFHRIERSYGSFARIVRAAADGRRWQGQRRVQGRRADGPAAAARGSQAQQDQGRDSRVKSLQRGGVEQPRLSFCAGATRSE